MAAYKQQSWRKRCLITYLTRKETVQIHIWFFFLLRLQLPLKQRPTIDASTRFIILTSSECSSAGFLFKLHRRALSRCPDTWLRKGWEELLPHPHHFPRDSGSLEQTLLSLHVGNMLTFYILCFLQKSHHALQFYPLASYKKKSHHALDFVPPGSNFFVKSYIRFHIRRPLNFSLQSLWLLCSQDSPPRLQTLRVMPQVHLSVFAR